MIVLPGDINSLAADLLLYGESLLSGWLRLLADDGDTSNEDSLIDAALRRGWSVTLLVNERFTPRNNNQVIQRNATRKNVEMLLSLDELARLRHYYRRGLFRVAAYSSDFPGTVLTELDSPCRDAVCRADNVVALGEQNNITLDGLNTDSYRIAPIRDFAHIFFTGIKFHKDDAKYPKFSILHVPAGVRAAIDYAPDVPTQLCAAQFAGLYRSLQPAVWGQLVEQVREIPDGNILGFALESRLLNAAERRSVADLKGLTRSERIEQASRLLEVFGGSYSRLATTADTSRARVMHIIRFPQKRKNTHGEHLQLGIEFARTENGYSGRPKTKLTFDDLASRQPNALFGFNFLYFLTRNLILYFNRSNPHFNLGECFFGEFVGFLKMNICGQRVLYPPLYNKGAIGRRGDGSFVFGRARLPECGRVTLPIGDRLQTLEWSEVNPEHPLGEKTYLYSPLGDIYREGRSLAPPN